MKLKHKIRQIKKPPVWIFLPFVIILRTLKLFMRTTITDPHNCLIPENYPYISVTWHNRLLFFPAMCPRYARQRTAAMISASRDGEYLSNIIKIFGILTVRGSSSRKGASAIRESLACLNNKINVAMTPDGPRGPKYKLSKGPIILGSKTGFQVLPLAINYSHYWELKSWDSFQIPKPWSKVELKFGDPVKIPSDLSNEEIEHWRLKIERDLNLISKVIEI